MGSSIDPTNPYRRPEAPDDANPYRPADRAAPATPGPGRGAVAPASEEDNPYRPFAHETEQFFADRETEPGPGPRPAVPPAAPAEATAVNLGSVAQQQFLAKQRQLAPATPERLRREAQRFATAGDTATAQKLANYAGALERTGSFAAKTTSAFLGPIYNPFKAEDQTIAHAQAPDALPDATAQRAAGVGEPVSVLPETHMAEDLGAAALGSAPYFIAGGMVGRGIGAALRGVGEALEVGGGVGRSATLARVGTGARSIGEAIGTLEPELPAVQGPRMLNRTAASVLSNLTTEVQQFQAQLPARLGRGLTQGQVVGAGLAYREARLNGANPVQAAEAAAHAAVTQAAFGLTAEVGTGAVAAAVRGAADVAGGVARGTTAAIASRLRPSEAADFMTQMQLHDLADAELQTQATEQLSAERAAVQGAAGQAIGGAQIQAAEQRGLSQLSTTERAAQLDREQTVARAMGAPEPTATNFHPERAIETLTPEVEAAAVPRTRDEVARLYTQHVATPAAAGEPDVGRDVVNGLGRWATGGLDAATEASGIHFSPETDRGTIERVLNRAAATGREAGLHHAVPDPEGARQAIEFELPGGVSIDEARDAVRALHADDDVAGARVIQLEPQARLQVTLREGADPAAAVRVAERARAHLGEEVRSVAYPATVLETASASDRARLASVLADLGGAKGGAGHDLPSLWYRGVAQLAGSLTRARGAAETPLGRAALAAARRLGVRRTTALIAVPTLAALAPNDNDRNKVLGLGALALSTAVVPHEGEGGREVTRYEPGTPFSPFEQRRLLKVLENPSPSWRDYDLNVAHGVMDANQWVSLIDDAHRELTGQRLSPRQHDLLRRTLAETPQITVDQVRRAITGEEPLGAVSRGLVSRLRTAVEGLPKRFDEPTPVADWLGVMKGKLAPQFNKAELELIRPALEEAQAAKRKLTREEVLDLIEAKTPQVSRVNLREMQPPAKARPAPDAEAGLEQFDGNRGNALDPSSDDLDEWLQNHRHDQAAVGQEIADQRAVIERITDDIEQEQNEAESEKQDAEETLNRRHNELVDALRDVGVEVNEIGTVLERAEEWAEEHVEGGYVPRNALDETWARLHEDIADHATPPDERELLRNNGYTIDEEDEPAPEPEARAIVTYVPREGWRPPIAPRGTHTLDDGRVEALYPWSEHRTLPEHEDAVRAQFGPDATLRREVVNQDAIDEYEQRREEGQLDTHYVVRNSHGRTVASDPDEDEAIRSAIDEEGLEPDQESELHAARNALDNWLDQLAQYREAESTWFGKTEDPESYFDLQYSDMSAREDWINQLLPIYNEHVAQARAAREAAERARQLPPPEQQFGPDDPARVLPPAELQRVNPFLMPIATPEPRAMGTGYETYQRIGGGTDYAEQINEWANAPSALTRDAFGGHDYWSNRGAPHAVGHIRTETHEIPGVVQLYGLGDPELVTRPDDPDPVVGVKQQIRALREQMADSRSTVTKAIARASELTAGIEDQNRWPTEVYALRDTIQDELQRQVRLAAQETKIIDALAANYQSHLEPLTVRVMLETQASLAQHQVAEMATVPRETLSREQIDALEAERGQVVGERERLREEWAEARSRLAVRVGDARERARQEHQFSSASGSPSVDSVVRYASEGPEPASDQTWVESVYRDFTRSKYDPATGDYVGEVPGIAFTPEDIAEIERVAAIAKRLEGLRDRQNQLTDQIGTQRSAISKRATFAAIAPFNEVKVAIRLNAARWLIDGVERGFQHFAFSDAANRVEHASAREAAAVQWYDQLTKGAIEGLLRGLGFSVKISHLAIRGAGHWYFELTPEMRAAIRRYGLPTLGVLALAVPDQNAEAQSPDNPYAAPGSSHLGMLAAGLGLAVAAGGVAYALRRRALIKSLGQSGVTALQSAARAVEQARLANGYKPMRPSFLFPRREPVGTEYAAPIDVSETPSGKGAAQFNVAKLGLSPEGESIFRDVVGQLDLTKHRVTHAETEAAAADRSVDKDVLLGEKPWSGTDALAARIFTKRAVDRLELLANRAADPATPAAEQAAIQAEMGRLTADVGDIGTRISTEREAAGRTLNAYKIVARTTLDEATWGMLAQRAKQLPLTSDEILKVRQLVAEKDREGLTQFVSSLHKSSFVDKALAWWKTNLLGLSTVAKVGTSHAIELATQTAEQPLIVGVDALVSLLRGSEREHAGAFNFRGGARLMGLVKGWREGLKMVRSGSTIPPEMAGRWDVKDVHYDTPLLNAWVHTIHSVHNLAYRPFYMAALEASLDELADVYAKRAVKADPSLSFAQARTALRAQPSNEMALRAIDRAERAVYQNQGTLAQLGSAVQRAARQRGAVPRVVVETAVPFVKIPANIAMRAIDASPLGLVTAALRASSGVAAKAGLSRQGRFAEDIARAFTGTAGFLALGYWLAHRNLATGDYPTNPGERNLWEDEGKQAHSVKLGGRWVNVSELGPQGMTVALGAELHRMLQENPGDASALFKGIAPAVGKTVADQPFLRGIATGLESLNDPIRAGGSYAQSQIGSLVPSMVNRAARTVDPYQREAHGIGEELMRRTPGLSRRLPARVTAFGNEREETPFGRAVAVPSPVNTRADYADRVDRELDRLGVGLPGAASSHMVEGERVATTPAERRAENAAVGPLKHTAAAAVLAAPVYQRLDDNTRAELLRRALELPDAAGRAVDRVMLTPLAPSVRDRLVEETMDVKLTGLLTEYAAGLPAMQRQLRQMRRPPASAAAPVRP